MMNCSKVITVLLCASFFSAIPLSSVLASRAPAPGAPGDQVNFSGPRDGQWGLERDRRYPQSYGKYFCSCGNGRIETFQEYRSGIFESRQSCFAACPKAKIDGGWKVRADESGWLTRRNFIPNPYLCSCSRKASRGATEHHWAGLVRSKKFCQQQSCKGRVGDFQKWIPNDAFSGQVTREGVKRYVCSCENRQTGKPRYWTGLLEDEFACKAYCPKAKPKHGWSVNHSRSSYFWTENNSTMKDTRPKKWSARDDFEGDYGEGNGGGQRH